ncbi:hypothetical protein SLEP1_g2677 [Rubroshorea leprosula]|uniref:Uncharacterized protein n=1 Tax=Rubroshorea leprosula TaxID=152421 RepID=A0AAV5HPH6_9ROSI|nr:hypothetical protein SLEP1_g2677 [Rubroshorea leprosula]
MARFNPSKLAPLARPAGSVQPAPIGRAELNSAKPRTGQPPTIDELRISSLRCSAASVDGSTAHRLAHHHSPSAPCSTGQKQQSKTPPSAALQLTIQPIIAHLRLHPPLDRSSNTKQNRINRSASLLRLSPPSPSSTKQKQQRKTKMEYVCLDDSGSEDGHSKQSCEIIDHLFRLFLIPVLQIL